jgi:hypothetical protein
MPVNIHPAAHPTAIEQSSAPPYPTTWDWKVNVEFTFELETGFSVLIFLGHNP